MKQLGELLLPDSLQWIDRYAFSPVRQTVSHTLSGTPVAFAHLPVGRGPITLVAEQEVTWLDVATVEALSVMAGQVGFSFPLVWETFSCTVLFRHQDSPALDMKPLWPHHNQFFGAIKLMAC